MFDDYWRIHCRIQDSAGKRTVKIQYFRRSAIPGKYLEVPISSNDRSSQKGETEVSHQGPTPPPGAGQP
jgi:hypothetical protein